MSQEIRFNWVLKGQEHGPDPCFDRDVLADGRAAVVPTKGSIVPGWLLVIPRVKVLSISELQTEDRQELLNVARLASDMVSGFSNFTFMFEHGPTRYESPVGCGVDQAHLHVVPLNFDLLSTVLNVNDGMKWERVSASDPWKALGPGKDYYLISDGSCAYAAHPSQQYSQYFRRKIADALGREEEWDYRSYPNHENAKKTVGHIVQNERFRKAA